MAKKAERYFKLDPWKIIEEGFDSEHNIVAESVFSLGNEFMGIRGYMEEGVSCESLLGSYFNGVYEYAKEPKKTAYKGIVERTHFMVNAVDWLRTRIELDGEMLDIAKADISGFRRELNLRSGTLRREFIWKTQSGKSIRVVFQRFISMDCPHAGFQQIILEPLDFSGTVHLEMGLDFATIHRTTGDCFWKEIHKGSQEGMFGIIGETLTTGIRIFTGFQLSSNRMFDQSPVLADRYIGCRFELPLLKGEESFVCKSVTNIVAKDPSAKEEALWEAGVCETALQAKNGMDAALQAQKQYWQHVWNAFDVQIEDDEERQQGIRFCIFQLHQTYHGQGPGNNIGAKGLTGEAYNGHTFWDTETYCLPFFLFNNINAAKNLLEFRYMTLENAKHRAQDLDCEGACYPVATITGDEACDLWQYASLQFQPSTGVAYGIRQYAVISGDTEFLYTHGVEMLVEISRFLCTRGSWSQTRNRFGFYAVMGPDEFHMMVNNNCYTNFMAQKTFRYTLEVIRQMKAENLERYDALIEKTGLKQTELDNFQICADKMIIPADKSTGVYEQHEGYFDLPHINVDEIPVQQFPLYNNWTYDRIYRTDMIKQPDVLMFLFLYSHDFSWEVKKANYEYYEPRTIHESSLSPSIHSVLANELKKYDEAFNFFSFATRMDLDNYNRNTGEGLHTTSLAAGWITIVYGFGGMRSDAKMLEFHPTIPDRWNAYSFRITYKGSNICVKADKKKVEFRLLQGAPVRIRIYDSEYEIGDAGVSIPLQK